VVSDLDGTLLHTDGTFSVRTADAVAALQDAGLSWVVATARPPRWLHDLSPLVGREGVAICSNGAFVYDVGRRVVMEERAIPLAALTELVEDLREAVPDIAFAVERSDGFGREHAYEDIHREPDVIAVELVRDLFDPPPGKLLARSRATDHATFLQTVQLVVADRAVVAYSGATGLAEISAAGVTKAAVLADMCAERGLSAEDVWAFGDMPNDLAMLSWAGTSFAVANAHPDVLRVATHVVRSNDEDGVADALESLVAGVSP
jgi:Cof subfamily protein (haloacid dehalogenase superfamily)